MEPPRPVAIYPITPQAGGIPWGRKVTAFVTCLRGVPESSSWAHVIQDVWSIDLCSEPATALFMCCLDMVEPEIIFLIIRHAENVQGEEFAILFVGLSGRKEPLVGHCLIPDAGLGGSSKALLGVSNPALGDSVIDRKLIEWREIILLPPKDPICGAHPRAVLKVFKEINK